MIWNHIYASFKYQKTKFYLLLLMLFASLGVQGAAFTSGNIVVYRVGSGTGSLANTGNPVFLDEYTPTGTLVQSISLSIFASGTAPSEGLLTRSTDGKYLLATGYAITNGSSLPTTTASTVNRVVARIDKDGNVDVTTTLSDFASGNNPRGVASTNGTDIWVTGGAGGIRYTTLGSTTSTQLSNGNLRAANIFNGQLYVSSGSNSSPSVLGVVTVGTGLPTTSSQTFTLIPGFPNSGSPYGFFFADMDAGVAGIDVLYVCDDGVGITKYSLVSGSWVSNGTIGVNSDDYVGITGRVNSNSVTLFATRKGGSGSTGGGEIISLIDNSGYNGAFSGTPTLLATALTNRAFRGVAFAPESSMPTTPTLSINDVSQAEGDAGTTSFTFTVSLSASAGAGGVTFDISTADNTATQPSDYTQNSLTGQTIPAGNSTYSFTVLVKGDVTTEPNETFFVNVTNVTGATVSDGQGQGTIQNDDVTLTPIHDIQGPGASSPIVGATASTRGIVTGVKNNGFFIQEPDATVDADPATSEGIFVFTSSAPPAAAVVGALVQVTGTVTEFVPSQDPLQPPLTQLTTPTVLQVSTGNPLPTSVPLTATFPDPAGPHDQLERLEGMRVSVTSLTVVGPTMGNINETNATATSSGVFYGVITGIARPFREAGIQAPDPAPSGGGTIPPIPRFDSNPERIRVDSDGLVGAPAINVSTSAVVSNLVGPLDYTFRTYTILPDPASPPSTSGGATATAVTTPTASEFTVASYNLQRFFDTVNDPGIGEAVLTTTAFNNRLNKASIGIRNFLKTPDIVGVVEVENLTTLQDLATRINNDAVAASQPNPQYAAYLVEGNDVGGIDVGFLVKTAPVAGATPRVTVNEVVQENKNELFVNPDASTDLLNDRPPLRLNATINHANGASFPVTVIANHLRSLNGVNSEDAGSNGWATTGARVRAKRQKQAESLANLVQARQTATPTERIIVLGDFNAFEVNDGFGHLMATIQGTPVPNNETAVAGDGADLVDPDLVNLFNTTPTAERYSYVFDGNAQSLDHILVNEDVVNSTLARRVEHPRINADFPETARNDGTTAIRLSDHDPVVSYYQVAAFAPSDLTIAKTTSSTFIRGGTASYNLTVTNSGVGSSSGTYTIMDVMPSGLTITNVSAGSGWDCTSSTATTVSCVSNNVISSGSSASLVTVSVSIANNAPASITNTATISGGGETNTTNNSSSVTSSVISQADLAITKTDGVSTAIPGGTVTYTITASNSGPSNAVGATVIDMFPATLTMVNWTCVGAGGGTCTASGSGNISDMVNLPSGGSVTYTVSATISPSATGTLVNTAIVSAPGGVTDPNPANNSATDTDTFTPQADLAITKTDGVSTAIPGGTVTYTITASNSGPSNAVGATVSDLFPGVLTNVTWTCVGAGGGTCTASGSGNINQTVNLPSGGSVTYTVSATISPSATGTLSNTATVSAPGGVTDPNPANNSATDTDVLAPQADLSVTMTDSPDPVAAGDNLTYTITAANAGPSIATSVVISNTLPAGTTFVSLSAPGGWSCTTPAVGAGGTISCSIASLGGGSSVFTLVVAVDPSVANGIVLSNTATIASSTPDPTNPTPGNNSATATTTVTNICSEIGTLMASPNPVCVSSTTTLTASNLVNMNIRGGYGIIFKYFDAPTSTPYTGGTTIATVPNSSLGSGGTQAAATTSFANSGTYYIYAILTPTPANVNCRPFATTTLTVLPVHTITLSSLAATEAQTICVNSPMTDITYSLGGGATGATVMGLPMGVTSTVNSGVLTISGTPTVTVGSPFNYNITTTGNNCTVATESGTVTVNTLSTAPMSITGTTTICAGGNTTLTLSGGSAGTGAIAEWFTGTCGGTPAGTGNSITVSPANTTTYFVRYNGTCNTTTCASSTVTVNTLSTAPVSITGTTTICAGGNTTLTLSGGSAGTGAIAEWFTGTCGGTPAGTGNSITVSPSNTTTYFVRYNGTCNTTTCTSSTVTVNALPMASISAMPTVVCQNAPFPQITFMGSGGTAPYTFTYKINNGPDLTVVSIGNTAILSQTTAVANTFTYTLVSVKDASSTQCSQSVGSSIMITVNAPPVVSTPQASLCTGLTLTLSPTSGGTWQSSNPSIATVNNAGLVTAIMAGSVNFTFTQTSTGCSSTTSNIIIKPTPTSNLTASKYDVCPNTEVTLNPNCSIPTSTVNWNPGAPTVTPAAATLPYVYKARCTADGCTGNESSVEVRTHRILVDMKDLDVGALPLPIMRAVKDNMAPTNLIQAPVFPRRWTFIANGCDASESAEFRLSGPVLFNTIDNTSTYAMFANEGNSFYSIDHPNYGNGGSFPDGTYTLTVNLRNRDGVGGPYPKNRVAVGLLLATRTLEFTVGNPSLRQGVGELETEFMEENWISLLQNPVNEEIVVRLSGKLGEDIDLSLVNLQGQMIQQRGLRLTSSEQNEVLRIGNSPTGLYILKAIKGDKVKTIKVIKVD